MIASTMLAKTKDKRQKAKGKGERSTARCVGGLFRPLLTFVFCLLSFAFLLIACTTTIKTTTHPRLGAGTRPPTDPAQVEVLHRPPMRAFVRLGKVRATPQGSADEQAIETALRKAAAGMGANAIIMGPGGDGESGAVVEATAIAYR